MSLQHLRTLVLESSWVSIFEIFFFLIFIIRICIIRFTTGLLKALSLHLEIIGLWLLVKMRIYMRFKFWTFHCSLWASLFTDPITYWKLRPWFLLELTDLGGSRWRQNVCVWIWTVGNLHLCVSWPPNACLYSLFMYCIHCL